MHGRSREGEGLLRAGGPGGDGGALRGRKEGMIPFAREIATGCLKGIRHAVVDFGGVWVELGTEWRGGGHLHVCEREAGDGQHLRQEHHVEGW